MMQIESAAARFYFSIKDNELRKRFISTGFTAIIVLSVLVTLIILISSSYISEISFGTDIYSLAIVLAVLHIPFSNINIYFNILIRFKKKPVIFLIIQSIQIITTFSVILYLLLQLDFGIKGVFIGELSGFVMGATISGIYLKKEYRLNFHKKDFKEIFRYSAPLVPAVASSWGNNFINRFVMLRYLTLVEIGLFSAAFKIASAVLVLTSAIQMAWGPFFWETFENKNHKEQIRKFHLQISFMLFIIVILISLSSKYLVNILLSDSYYESYKYIGLIAFSFVVSNLLVFLSSPGTTILKKTEQNTFLYAISLLFNVLIMFFTIERYGLKAVVISMIITNTFLLFISWWNSERLFKYNFYRKPFILLYVLTLAIIIYFSEIIDNI
jgi:O-antigen/teichoic acid export membrane protein